MKIFDKKNPPGLGVEGQVWDGIGIRSKLCLRRGQSQCCSGHSPAPPHFSTQKPFLGKTWTNIPYVEVDECMALITVHSFESIFSMRKISVIYGAVDPGA